MMIKCRLLKNHAVLGILYVHNTSSSLQVNVLYRRAFRDELALLQRIRHPNVVQFLGAVTQSSPMMIVMEYLPKVCIWLCLIICSTICILLLLNAFIKFLSPLSCLSFLNRRENSVYLGYFLFNACIIIRWIGQWCIWSRSDSSPKN